MRQCSFQSGAINQKRVSLLLFLLAFSANQTPAFATTPACSQGSVAVMGANDTLSCAPSIKVDSRGWIGFGVDPLYNLDVLQSSGFAFEPTGSTGLAVRSYSNDTAARSTLLRARGSLAQPQAVEAGDALGNFRADAFDGDTFVPAGRMRVIAAENWTPTSHGALLAFGTTPANATAPVDQVFIMPSGEVGIGTSAPKATLDVAGSFNATEVMVDGRNLTLPPVCLARNFLQFDGRNWHCTPIP